MNADRKTDLRVENEILITLAGIAAEAILSGRSNFRGAARDFKSAAQLALCVNGSAEAASAHLHWLFIRTRNMLFASFRRQAVAAFAKELLKRKRIGYHAAIRIIKDAMKVKLSPPVSNRSRRNQAGARTPTSVNLSHAMKEGPSGMVNCCWARVAERIGR